MIVEGKKIAEEIYAALEMRRANFKNVRLGILVVGVDPVIEQFVGIKKRSAEKLGIEMERVDLSKDVTTTEAITALTNLASKTDAVIAQLPMPPKIDIDAVLRAIPMEKDVDALNPAISENKKLVHAPVALAVIEILKRSNVEIAGKRVVVVGAGRLVGAPSAALLKKLGADVSLFTLDEGSIKDLKSADIVVLGVGKPGFIKPEHLKKGVVLIDAGASESEGKVRGDADQSCAEVASVFTPVPGGVGPIAVAMIFKNFFDLLEKN